MAKTKKSTRKLKFRMPTMNEAKRARLSRDLQKTLDAIERSQKVSSKIFLLEFTI